MSFGWWQAPLQDGPLGADERDGHGGRRQAASGASTAVSVCLSVIPHNDDQNVFQRI